MSFISVLNNLKIQIETNENLQAFCKSQWNKTLECKIAFRQRREINSKDLPILLITRPRVSGKVDAGQGRISKQRVRLYFGFYQKNADRGVLEQVQFEELIDAAIIKDTSFGDVAEGTDVLDSVSDEGVMHPSYFTVMDLDIKYCASVDESDLDSFITFYEEMDMAPQDEQIDIKVFETLDQEE